MDSSLEFGRWLAHPAPGEEVVVTGISGRYPESNSVLQFQDNLFNKTDMVTDDDRRWKLRHPEIPHRGGRIFNIDKLDAGYFGLHYRQTGLMDAMIRKFLECTTEAILDAGINPKEIEGSRTIVVVGNGFADSEELLSKCREKFGLTGYLRCLIAHRVSYFFKLKGISCIVDTGCSSSFNALEEAFRLIRMGKCDNAIVGGTNLVLHPGLTRNFFKLGATSPDGTCKVFDESANGYVRSEAIVCVFLQKARYARRIYMQILHSKVNIDGYKPSGITVPSWENQKKLMTEILEESDITASEISFVEAHGTATVVGDPQEVQSIDEAIAKKRNRILLVGSVKSNVGHTEPPSGLVSLSKIVIAMETGLIPPNIHFKKARKELLGLVEGRMKVVTEATPLDTDDAIIGINNFGFGGTNVHVLTQMHKKVKNYKSFFKNEGHQLVCVSGRTKEAVLKIFEDVKKKIDSEQIGLLNKIFQQEVVGHIYRGFTILSRNGLRNTNITQVKTKKSLGVFFGKFEKSFMPLYCILKKFSCFNEITKEIKDVLKIVTFATTSKNEIINNDIFASFVVQMGLVEFFKFLKLKPDSVFGDSIGEIVCAYYHEQITLKEAVFAVCNTISATANEDQHGKCARKLNTQASPNNNNIFEGLRNITKIKTSLFLNVSDNKLEGNNILSFEQVNELTFLEILGRLYQEGYNFQLDKLYPLVEFPVSRSTPMISPIVRWNYQKSWDTFKYKESSEIPNFVQEYGLYPSLQEEEKCLLGHVVDERTLVPATKYLEIVRKAFLQCFKKTDECPVVFENCKFIRATAISQAGGTTLIVSIQKTSGNFEILEKDALVVNGRIFSPENVEEYMTDLPTYELSETPVEVLEQDDIYKELHLRGYNYRGMFKNMVKCNVDGSAALVKWENNWTTFLDNVLQVKILQFSTRSLCVPIGIRKVAINPIEHEKFVENQKDSLCLVNSYKEFNIIKCGGIEISGLQGTSISKKKQFTNPVLEKYIFLSNLSYLNYEHSLRVILQIIYENHPEKHFNAIEIHDDCTSQDPKLLSPLFFKTLEDMPTLTIDFTISSKEVLETEPPIKTEDLVLTSSSNFHLIIGTKLYQRPNVLNEALDALTDNGFLLTREEINFVLEDNDNLGILCEHVIGNEKLVFLHKLKREEHPVCIEMRSKDFNWFTQLQEALKTDANVIIHSQNLEPEGILGLVNCLRKEPKGNKIKCFFIMDAAPKFDISNKFYERQWNKQMVINVFKEGKWGTYRHLKLENLNEVEGAHFFVQSKAKGDLTSLKWVQGPLTADTKLPTGYTLVFPFYTALNFKDIMVASGRIEVANFGLDRTQEDCCLGFEFSGIDANGRRVMGVSRCAAQATIIAADSEQLIEVPDDWNLEDASTVVTVYATVIYALLKVGNIKSGMSILIHSGTGGVGLAAINTCLYYNLNIYLTVGNQEKREYIQNYFPQICESHIGNSRDESFEEMIKTQTQGRGVDFVLNSLSEEKLRTSIRCMAPGGHFLEIGKYDMGNDAPLSLLLLERNVTYHGIMLDTLFSESHKLKKWTIEKIREGMRLGYVKSLPKTVFQYEEIIPAYRYMTTGKHIGKVVIKIRDENDKPFDLTKSIFKGDPRFTCDPEKSYIILGGLGGFGLELADWMYLRGVKKLVLSSRHGIISGYQKQKIKNWSSNGVTIQVSTKDITTKDGCIELINDSNKLGPIDGIFNLAMVLKDELFENQSKESFTTCLAPKAKATIYLDQITRQQCPELRYFVVFSSASCGRGNMGQTNYGMANSIMERICEKRKLDGLPGLAIQWGAIGDVGVVAKMQHENREIVISGTIPQKISSCMEVLDKFLKQDFPVVSSMVVASRTAKSGLNSAVDVVAHVLGIKDINTVGLHTTFGELGMDSLMGTEVKQVLEKEFDIYVTAKELRNLTFAKLKELENQKENNDINADVIDNFFNFFPTKNKSDLALIEMPNKLRDSKIAKAVFFLPGSEGVLEPMAFFSELLEARVLGTQYATDTSVKSIAEYAKILFPHFEEIVREQGSFFCISYSFGATVALELISLLEAKGFSGYLVLIEGSPEYISTMIRQSSPVDKENEFETIVLFKMLALLTSVDPFLKKKNEFLSCKNSEERFELALSILPPELTQKSDIHKDTFISMCNRLKAAANYKFSHPKIKSHVHLFKAERPAVLGLGDDYQLSEICEQPVQITTVEGDHYSILREKHLVDEINRLLKI